MTKKKKTHNATTGSDGLPDGLPRLYPPGAGLCLAGLQVPGGLLCPREQQRLLLQAAKVHLGEEIGARFDGRCSRLRRQGQGRHVDGARAKSR